MYAGTRLALYLIRCGGSLDPGILGLLGLLGLGFLDLLGACQRLLLGRGGPDLGVLGACLGEGSEEYSCVGLRFRV